MPSTHSEDSSKKAPRSSSKPSQTERASEEVPKKSGDSTKPAGPLVSDASKEASSKPGSTIATDQKNGPDVANTEGDSLVDMETFGQLLEMDDDEEHTFSKSLTWDYFDQAVTTFKEMDAAVLSRDLITLSRKGHFLKGSSAALGLNKVKASCEKMQHYGNRKKANGEGTLTEDEAMECCKELLEQLKDEQTHSKAWLERFYAERNV